MAVWLTESRFVAPMIRFVHAELLKLFMRIRGSPRAILSAIGTFAGATILAFVIEGALLQWMANSFAVIDKLGIIGLLATLLFSLGTALITLQWKLKPEDRDISQIQWGSIIALVTAIFIGLTMVKAVANTTGKSTATPSILPPASPGSTTAAPPAPSGVPVPSAAGCPLPDPTDPSLPSIEVKVVYWCKGDVFTSDDQIDSDNYQIKVRPRLINNTKSTMNISINSPSAIRLLVTGKQIDQRWSPPSLTKDLGDRPILVRCNGGTFWAIPPNAPRDVSTTSTGQYAGFATSWDGVELGPGQSYFKPLRHRSDGSAVQEGNLVFQIPLDENDAARIYGLAVLDPENNSVLGIALFDNDDQWGAKLHPVSF